jgi:hypothetical protein
MHEGKTCTGEGQKHKENAFFQGNLWKKRGTIGGEGQKNKEVAYIALQTRDLPR